VLKCGLELSGRRNIVLRWWLALSLVLIPSAAAAQDSALGPVEKTSLPTPWAEGHRWTRAGLDEDVMRLEVTPSGVILALTREGAIWRWGAESSWREVLGRPGARLEDPDAIDEEAMLLDAESLLNDQSDFPRAGRIAEEDEEESDTEDDGKLAEPVVGAFLDGDDAAELLIQGWVAEERSLPAGRALWASRAVAGLLLCDREDGTWRSDDDGQTWESVSGLPATHAFADLSGVSGGVLAGTRAGLRTSLDQGRSWVEVDDPLSGVPVYSFTSDTERTWAGTEEGLFVSSKVLGWAKLVPRRDSDVPVWALADDPYWPGGLWLAGPVGILRTDDGGESLRPSGRNPLRGTRTILPLDGAGHVLAAGEDGVWESLDGGIQWRPLARGLPHPQTMSLVQTQRGILVASVQGVFLLRRAAPEATEDFASAIEALANDPPMGELVDVALRRPGLRISSVLTQQNLMVSMLLPQLTLVGRADRIRYITADHQALSNKGGHRWGWFFGTTLCFGNCSSSVSFADVDAVALAEDYGVEVRDLTELAVVGDEVYAADTMGALAPVAANVAERMTQYRSEVANRVSEIALARRRLVQARFDVRSLSLRDQAAHELRILESGARLDVYTNGYFTRVLDGR
jgi:photosystem II stability/assembly factor-like uncharacterized protein